MRYAYLQCQSLVNDLSDEEVLALISKEYNTDALSFQDSTRTYYRTFPFAESNDTVISFAQEGILSAKETQEYFDIKNRYPALMEGKMNVSELARVCGLSRPTIYKYMKMIA